MIYKVRGGLKRMGPISKRERGVMKKSETYFNSVSIITFRNTALLGDIGAVV